MVITATALDERIRDIDDPELPHVTIGDLGIVRSVEVTDDVATVILTPTYTGCPATEQIRDDVVDTVRDAGLVPDVRFAISPAWTTDWITERGRERLRAPASRPRRPSVNPARPSSIRPSHARGVRHDTPASSPSSAATACKASYVCNACSEPFELFKAL